MTETEILDALKRSDPSALEEAIRQYSRYAMAVVQRTLGRSAPEEDKEELVMDVFVALWKNAPKLADGSRLKPWIAVVARNAAINKGRSLHPSEELQEDFLVSDDEVSTPVEQEERAQSVRQAVDGLQEEDRELFLRHYFWHQSIGLISAETGMNQSTIKSRLFRGRQALKTVLTQRGYTV